MELKVRILDWAAGVPSAMLNQKTAERLGIHTKDRISLRTTGKRPKETSTTLDTIKGIMRENEIGISSELREILDVKQGQKVDVNLAIPPKSMQFIKDKLDGKELSKKNILAIISDIVGNELSDSEIALFVSGMYKQGMNKKETIFLIDAIRKTGNELKVKNKIVADKHSIGGVPGNRTTPIVVSICASLGLTMPKTSSRAITSSAGTADVIETLASVEFSVKELKNIINKAGAFMVWGGYVDLVPADSKIIRVEKALKIDPMAMLLASVMSKKLAVGSKYIIIDIPCGIGAKVGRKRALILKKKFEELGKHFRIKIKCTLTDGSQPIGNGVGPGPEMRDIISILDPEKQGPKDLEEKSLILSGELLELTKICKKGQGYKMAEDALRSGKAFEKFRQIIEAQNGSLKNLKTPSLEKTLYSSRAGKVKVISNSDINSLAMITGCPLDKSAGLYLHVLRGQKVKKRQKLITIYANSETRLNEAVRFFKKEKPIKVV